MNDPIARALAELSSFLITAGQQYYAEFFGRHALQFEGSTSVSVRRELALETLQVYKGMGSFNDADTMIMGRDMAGRVKPYALEEGAGYYEALPSSVYRFTDEHMSSIHDQIHLWANKKWINYQMMQGKTLIDIGAPGGARPSAYDDMELQQTSGYGGYISNPMP